jgi:HAD superfamily hydrolase (TIGR01509 family)
MRPSLQGQALHPEGLDVYGNRFRALLWDNDGVLVDTEILYFQATREVLAGAGVELTEAQYVELFLVDNVGIAHFASRLGEASEIDRLRARRNARYSSLLAESDVTIPGAPDVLAALAPHFRMGMVTSTSREHLAIAHARAGLLRHFEIVVAEGDYARSKPHPDPYQEAVRLLGVEPNECLVIEDSRRGLLAAKAAGLACWVVRSRFSHRSSFAEADRILDDVRALPEALGAE